MVLPPTFLLREPSAVCLSHRATFLPVVVEQRLHRLAEGDRALVGHARLAPGAVQVADRVRQFFVVAR
jgi:hypothetical protein